MILWLAQLLAAIISGGTAAILAAISYLPPMALRMGIVALLLGAGALWVRHVNRPVRR